jgi:NAD(P)H-dependent FMN reductase
MTLRLLAFAASLRRGSFNRKLVAVASEYARRNGAEVDLADFHEFDMPLYDGDLQETDGLPRGAQELIARIERADGLLIASPEYNYSMAGTMKNAIDWVSRAKPMPLRGRSAFLMATSNTQVGGGRGLWQLRVPLEALGVFVYPDMFALAFCDRQFDGAGKLTDPGRKDRLEKMLDGYLRTARALAGVQG